MDFDTTNNRGKRHRSPANTPGSSTGRNRASSPRQRGGSGDGGHDDAFVIPAGSRKAALVHLALEAHRVGQPLSGEECEHAVGSPARVGAHENPPPRPGPDRREGSWRSASPMTSMW